MNITNKLIKVLLVLIPMLILLFVGSPVYSQGGSWETMSPMPTARWGSAVGVIDGIVYVAGGYHHIYRHMGTVEAYDPESDTWFIKNPRPTVNTSPAFGVVNGFLYTAGGVNCCVNMSWTWEYNPIVDSWTQKAKYQRLDSDQRPV